MSNQTSRRDERGAVAVEMALVLIPFLVLVFGMIDFAAAYNAQIQLNQAAQAGARMATIDPTQVQSRVAAASPGLFGGGSPAVAVAACPTNPPTGSSASVTVAWTYNLVVPIPLLPDLNSIDMSQTAVMPCGS